MVPPKKSSGKFSNILVSFYLLRNICRYSGKFSFAQEYLQILWKVFICAGIFEDTLESFDLLRNICRYSGKFLGVLKIYQHSRKFGNSLNSCPKLQKVSKYSGKYPDTLNTLQTIYDTFCSFFLQCFSTVSFMGPKRKTKEAKCGSLNIRLF